MKYPFYLNLSETEWKKRVKKAWKMLNPCRVCPRGCKVNRLDRNSPKAGFCQTKEKAIISSYHPHHWEERCISGWKGSGIIFFTSCNLACVFCQNHEISQLRLGQEVSNEKLASMMLELQNMGCHNINLCSPSIYVAQILKAAFLAVKKGLRLPFVWNSGGYDSVESLKLLEGIVDIYMPDIKYSDNKMGAKYSLVSDYWDKVQVAIKEMHHQVQELVIDKNGLAVKGLLVRHLVLPNGIAGSKKVMEFLAKEVSKDTYLNIMDQYYPYHKAYQFPELSRRISREEFEEALNFARSFGLWRFDKENFRER